MYGKMQECRLTEIIPFIRTSAIQGQYPVFFTSWAPLGLTIGSSCGLMATATAAKSLQLCLTLCDPIDGSPQGFSVPGTLQARTLEWVAISFSNAWKWKVKVKSLSHVWLLATPWTAAYQAPPSMGFSREEYWSGVPLPSLLMATRSQVFFSLLSALRVQQHTLEGHNGWWLTSLFTDMTGNIQFLIK